MYLNKLKTQVKLVKFKKRFVPKLIFKENIFSLVFKKTFFTKFSYIFLSNSINIELFFYKFFIKKLRKLSRRKNFKSFIFLYCNHCFSKKSKNSRMGKGKGKFVRFICRKYFLQPVFVFSKISSIRIQKFTTFLNTKSRNKFFYFY